MSFDDAMRFTREEERGYSNDPDDPGGRTFDGIAEHANPELWRDGKVTEEEIFAAYAARFMHIRGKELPSRIALVLFDWYFQSGTVAVRALQKLIGAIPDGIMGDHTVGAIQNRVRGFKAEDSAIAMELIEARAGQLGKWVNQEPGRAKFVTGFMRRLARLANAIERM